jgi:hypothetical protein
MSDPRSRASEEYAFKELGYKRIIHEDVLMREFEGRKVPEGIFMDGRGNNVSVEVKRIIGNVLPADAETGERRKVWRQGRIIWPWKITLLSALEKANEALIEKYNVRSHHIVVLVPARLSKREFSRIKRRCESVASECVPLYESLRSLRSVFLHVIRAPDENFDRF